MRVSGPNTTAPVRAGPCAAASFAFASASATFAAPATSATRTPPFAGTVNGCDRSVSPSMLVSAVTWLPTATLVNSARPCASVTAVTLPSGVVRPTSWLGTLFPMRSRTTRTVTVPSGSSVAGSGTPDICRASGIATCAITTAPRASVRTNTAARPPTRGRIMMRLRRSTRHSVCRTARPHR